MTVPGTVPSLFLAEPGFAWRSALRVLESCEILGRVAWHTGGTGFPPVKRAERAVTVPSLFLAEPGFARRSALRALESREILGRVAWRTGGTGVPP